MIFKDRVHAANLFIEKLQHFKNQKNVVVLGLARGGAVLAYEIAKELKISFHVLTPKKIGAPHNTELAIGAVIHDGQIWLNSSFLEMMQISESWLEKDIKELVELSKKRFESYVNVASFPEIKNKTILLVDDGIATGATMFVAIKFLRQQKAKSIICLSPVASKDVWDEMKKYCDDAICLNIETDFGSVSEFYERFEQVEDAQVIDLLKKSLK